MTRVYFPNGIILLPFGHPSLEEISEFKTEKGQKIEIYFWQGKEKLSAMEKTALQKTKTVDFYYLIIF